MRKFYFSFSLILSYSFSIAQSGTISTVAGGNIGNNVTANTFGINPFSTIPDNLGNIYIADASNHLIHKLNISSGKLTVFAGTGSYGYAGDGGQATNALMNYPVALAFDKAGNLYVADEYDECVRKINIVSGIITTVAGNGSWGFSGDGGLAVNAQFDNPAGIVLDTADNIYISDYSNNRIRKVLSANGKVFTIAGTDSTGYNKDSIVADSAWLNGPAGITLDKKGNIYFVDQNNCRIRMINISTDTIYTLAGSKAGFSGDKGPASAARFWYPLGIALDSANNIYISDTYENRIRKINHSNDTINTIIGNGTSAFSGDGGPASAAEVWQPHYLSFDKAGNLFIADMANGRIREVTVSNGNITTLAGDGFPGYNGNNISALTTQLSNPTGVATDVAGNIYIVDNGDNMVREVDASTGNILKVAGTGIGGYSGDGGPAGKAQLSGPDGIALDASGNIYVADESNNRIREINAVSNTITTVAGNGSQGFSGDNSIATSAELFEPVDVAFDSAGNMYIADMINNRIREVYALNKHIKTIVGNGYGAKTYGGGFSGDGGPATAAELYQPQGIAVDRAGNIYIADTWNDRIRKVDAKTHIITTIGGNGNWNYTGDGGPATDAQLGIPTCVRLDGYGNIYIADYYNNAVRVISVWDSTISTVAGNGYQNYSGDGGPATSAELDLAHGLCFDNSYNLYIADNGNNRIREVMGPLSVNNISNNSSVLVYPNPASDLVNISLKGTALSNAILKITDIAGRFVMTKKLGLIHQNQPITLDISSFSNGIYIVNISDGKQQLTSKVVKW